MKKIVILALACCLLAGMCQGCVHEDEAGSGAEQIVSGDGKILLDNIYACEKIADSEDGGAFMMTASDGTVFYTGYNPDGTDVFSFDEAVGSRDFGLDGNFYGIGVTDAGFAFVQSAWDRDAGSRMQLVFADAEAGKTAVPVDFTNALPGLPTELEMNGIPDFTIGRTPGGAAVSDGSAVALVSFDGTLKTLDLPGRILSVTTDENGELCLYLVNAVADRSVYSLHDGELVLVTGDLPKMQTEAIYKAGDDLLALTQTGFYRVTDSGEAEMILNFEHSALIWSEQYRFCVVSPDEIYYSGRNDITKDNGLYCLTPAEDQVRRVVEVMNFADDALDTFASQFNASQSEYFVIGVRPQLETSSNADALLDEFDKKLLAGESGDLVCLNDSFDWEGYANQRIFTDLSHLFGEGELFPCVTDALERNGQLSVVCRSFMISTMYTMDEVWKTTELTPSELIAYAENLPETSRIFWNMGQPNVLYSFRNGMSGYIDAENAVSGFACDDFIRTLNYISSMPEEFETAGRASSPEIYLNGDVVFRAKSVYSIESWLDMQRFEHDGKKFIEAGYPTVDGGRANLIPFEYYAIPSDADEKEGAEAFLRFVLNSHTRMGDAGIPADVTAFRDLMEDAKGYFFEYEPDSIDNMYAGHAEWYEPENENQTLITDELIAQFEDWLTDIGCVIPLPSELESIINEEISAYLAGTCSAEECADKIDSRIGIYLSERS